MMPTSKKTDRAAAPVVSDTTPEVPSAPRAGEEDELQAKPLASAITPLLQRETQEEELQAKFVQCATSETGRFDSIQRQRLEDQELPLKAVPVNDDDGLEQEADVMGEKAAQMDG